MRASTEVYPKVGRVIESFSFSPKYMSVIDQVKDDAKKLGISYSELLLSIQLEYVRKNDLDEKKQHRLLQEQQEEQDPIQLLESKKPQTADFQGWKKFLECIPPKHYAYIEKVQEECSTKIKDANKTIAQWQRVWKFADGLYLKKKMDAIRYG